jgi:hypothetical protein
VSRAILFLSLVWGAGVLAVRRGTFTVLRRFVFRRLVAFIAT